MQQLARIAGAGCEPAAGLVRHDLHQEGRVRPGLAVNAQTLDDAAIVLRADRKLADRLAIRHQSTIEPSSDGPWRTGRRLDLWLNRLPRRRSVSQPRCQVD